MQLKNYTTNMGQILTYFSTFSHKIRINFHFSQQYFQTASIPSNCLVSSELMNEIYWHHKSS